MSLSTPPKGSLEDLFRHHLLESELAAVPPRPQVWEQLDNSLLLAQNEQYRRRLRVHRWAIAASLLLASLAGGGWWHSQRPAASLAIATATGPAAGQPGSATARRAGTAPTLTATRQLLYSATPTPSAIDQTATLRAAAQPTTAYATARPAATPYQVAQATAVRGAAAHYAAELTAPATSHTGARQGHMSTAEAGSLNALAAAMPAQQGALPLPSGVTSAHQSISTSLTAGDAGRQSAMAFAGANTAAEEAQTAAVTNLAARPAGLVALGSPALPASLSPVEVEMPPVELARHWQYGLSYAASAYQPNIDFTKPAASYNPSFGLNSASLTNSAAAEYRNNLRAGLGQRLGVWASRRLGGSRWRLRTGLELAQNTASSASSVSFVGEQVADLTYAQAMQAHLQRTSYRYRSASAAAEMRYASPLKTGFSLYGRVGALFTALLNAHSEVDGTPEATRTYTLLSSGSPYRHLTTSLRGGAGIQYRPVGHQWALNLGPVAEFGILSLNADPNQDFWHQQRPYSFGLEAGLELGRPLRLQ